MTQISFFPLDFTYKIEDDKVFVYLFGKLKSNEKICIKHEYKPYFYCEFKEIPEYLRFLEIDEYKILNFEKVEKELLGIKKEFYKVYVNIPKGVPILSKEFFNNKINCFETDILFIYRYLRDNKIIPLILTEVEGEFINENYKVRVFLANKIKQIKDETIKKTKILAIDIETYAENKIINTNKNPILMIAFSGVDELGDKFRKVITWKNFKSKQNYVEIVNSEKEMLERFVEIINDYLPDIITGYFSDGFDLPYIEARANKLKVKLKIGLDNSSLYISSKMNNGDAKIKGILHLDVFKFIKYIFGKNLKTTSYSLNSVANELLNLRKHDVDISGLYRVWNEDLEGLSEYTKYNLQDADLTLDLFEKLFFDMVEFSKIIGIPIFDVIRMSFSRLVENYILRRAQEFNVIAPNKPGRFELEKRMRESIQGAFVYQPTAGLYKDVVVFDFKSLYPTIIISHNIDPESLQCKCCSDYVPEREEYWFCKNKKAFLPTVLKEIIDRRSVVKFEIKKSKSSNVLKARSYALKILANSFYGYMIFYGARWYCLPCGESTTAYARDYIKNTINKAKERGFVVCYGDTDSVFFQLNNKKLEDAMKFMDEINLKLPGQMELEFEGYYPKAIFVSAKGSEIGAKKKYALLDEDGNLKITGFESVRRNTALIAKEVQEAVLRYVLNGKVEQAFKFVQKIVEKLKEGKVSVEKLIINTRITKSLDDYRSFGPHVKVARELEAKGEDIRPGTVVSYVITKGFGLVRERARIPENVKEYDAKYYIKNHIIPAVKSIFLALGYGEEDILKKSKQIGLGKFI